MVLVKFPLFSLAKVQLRTVHDGKHRTRFGFSGMRCMADEALDFCKVVLFSCYVAYKDGGGIKTEGS